MPDDRVPGTQMDRERGIVDRVERPQDGPPMTMVEAITRRAEALRSQAAAASSGCFVFDGGGPPWIKPCQDGWPLQPTAADAVLHHQARENVYNLASALLAALEDGEDRDISGIAKALGVYL